MSHNLRAKLKCQHYDIKYQKKDKFARQKPQKNFTKNKLVPGRKLWHNFHEYSFGSKNDESLMKILEFYGFKVDPTIFFSKTGKQIHLVNDAIKALIRNQ